MGVPLNNRMHETWKEPILQTELPHFIILPEGGRLQTQQALRTASSSDGDGLADFRRRFVLRESP